ncbi:hypothetical protein HPB52_021354 [Rhipicephalus sanguineus]|uniref:Tick transposon n=1 Tax=Rhipicephalus sanguineus TaxID=34632 RepID=A0A9D4PLT4_RHISA|nr:hypothetical protein HPB52_021354 [Rhipicephalus sanguineus]
MAFSSANTTVWQWNCRGFARKRPVLQEFLTASDRPELIALQEGGKNTQLADSAKGRRLWNDWHTHQLTLITDVSYPTRLGSGLHRDTTPDLPFTSSGDEASSCNTNENFLSDHSMLEIVIKELTRQRTRPAQVINWDLFRAHWKEQAAPPTITNINAWTTIIVKQVADATQTVDVSPARAHGETLDGRDPAALGEQASAVIHKTGCEREVLFSYYFVLFSGNPRTTVLGTVPISCKGQSRQLFPSLPLLLCVRAMSTLQRSLG